MYLAATKENVKIQKFGNEVVLVKLPELSADVWELTVPGGFFFECSGENLDGLYPALTRKCQTLTCVNETECTEVAEKLICAGVSGVDLGGRRSNAKDFSLIWDGMDLIAQMSRLILSQLRS